MKTDWLMGLVFGILVSLGVVSFTALVSNRVCAQTLYENSPYNYKNSEYNYENSSYNYKNSPYNYENSPYNVNSKNGIYDNNGNRIGYETRSDQGTRNIYDNNGNRIGYGR